MRDIASSTPPALPRRRAGDVVKVFISSTSKDLYQHRAAVRRTIETMGVFTIAMENFGSRPEDAVTVSTNEVANADIFILIVAWRYGFIPDGDTLSVTHQEYRKAESLKLPILVFLADESTERETGPDALFPTAVRDDDPTYREQLMGFRAEVGDGSKHTRDTFTGPDNLAARVAAALHNALETTSAPLVRDFPREQLKLGRASAANRDYAYDALPQQYQAIITALEGAAQEPPTTSGAIVLGVSSSGKTRLAYEALRAALPEWRLLIWYPSRASADIRDTLSLRGRRVVLWLDDLQDFAVGEGANRSLSAGPPAVLRELVESLRGWASQVVVVATCRDEEFTRANASLGWLISTLTRITIPLFSKDRADPQSAAIIARMAAHGPVSPADWNGRIGSLVLGLEAMQEYYDQLAAARAPAIAVLRAMKLLTRAGITDHTETRLRAVCAEIIGQGAPLAEWQAAVADLTRLQFAREEQSSEDAGSLSLRINHDYYLDHITPDYDDPARPGLLDHDRHELRSVLARLRDDQGLFFLAAAWYDLKRPDEALVAFERALALAPSDPDYWYGKGAALVELKRPEEALVAFERALALAPTGALYWNGKGNALVDLKQPEQALVAFERALALAPSDPDYWYGKGAALVDLKRPDEALAAFERALALDPSYTYAWHGKGAALVDLKQPEEALAAFERALALDPSFAYAWHGKGNALVELKRPDEALAAFERALALDPSDPDYWYGKGAALRDLKDYEGAASAFREASRLASDDVVYLRNLAGVLLDDLDRSGEALDVCQRATQLDPSSIRGWRLLGDALRKLQQAPEAAASYQRALALEADNALDVFNRGLSLAGLGRYQEALEAYDRALEDDPGDEETLRARDEALRAMGRFTGDPDSALASQESGSNVSSAQTAASRPQATYAARQSSLLRFAWSAGWALCVLYAIILLANALRLAPSDLRTPLSTLAALLALPALPAQPLWLELAVAACVIALAIACTLGASGRKSGSNKPT